MKKMILFLVLIVIVLPFPVYGDGMVFSTKEVNNNVIKYLNVVFGSKKPTLQDYVNFEGIDPGYEAELTLQSCKIMLPSKDPEESKECGKYINFRYNNKDKVDSLYYNLLREKLAITPSLTQNAEIHVFKNTSNNAYRVSVIFRTINIKLIIGHALRRDLAELGLVGIIEVNGISVQKYLGLKGDGKQRGQVSSGKNRHGSI